MNNSETNDIKLNILNRYAYSRIYKLIDDINQFYYIGSTCCASLAKRRSWHVSMSKQKPNINVYQYFNNIGWDHVKILLVEELALSNKEKLLRAENELITKYFKDPKCLNSVHSVLDVENQKKKNQQWKKKHYEDNKEEILEKMKRYYYENIEKIKEYREISKEQKYNKYMQNIEKKS